jgi:hypothetical protein
MKGDEYHTATALYLTTLFQKGMGLTQATVHHGTNDQSRKTADTNKQISGCYYQSVDSQESDHPYQVNENIENRACDTESVVGQLYSVQYKSIFGTPDKVRHNMCDKARPLSQV